MTDCRELAILPTDPVLGEHFEAYLCSAIEEAARLFHRPPAVQQVRIAVTTDGPETKPLGSGGYLVTVDRNTPQNWHFQLAHESVHCVLGAEHFHWSHELLATVFSIASLSQSGDLREEGNRCRRFLIEQAAGQSINEALSYKGIDSRILSKPAYGRLYLLGSELRNAFGWDALLQLAAGGPGGAPQDVVEWVESLGSREALLPTGFKDAAYAAAS